MERLRLGDIQQLLEFVRGCYAVGDFESFVDHTVTMLPRVIASELTAYGEISPRARQFKMVESPKGIWTNAILEAFRYYLHEHPFARSYRGGGDGSARQLTDVMPFAAWQRTAVYNESFRPAGFDHEMVVWLPARGRDEITVAVHRRRRGFTDRDRLMLDLLRPHIAQARRNALLLTRLRSAVDTATHGLIAVDEHLRPLFVSQPARALLDKYFGGRGWSGHRLPDMVRRWLQHQRIVLYGTRGAPPEMVPLVVNGNGAHLLISYCRNDADVLLLEEQQVGLVDATDLAPLGLTRREAEVLAWVAKGKTNEEIGRILGISARTTAKHLEKMYAKLGVENRTAAAALALTLRTLSRPMKQ